MEFTCFLFSWWWWSFPSKAQRIKRSHQRFFLFLIFSHNCCFTPITFALSTDCKMIYHLKASMLDCIDNDLSIPMFNIYKNWHWFLWRKRRDNRWINISDRVRQCLLERVIMTVLTSVTLWQIVKQKLGALVFLNIYFK